MRGAWWRRAGAWAEVAFPRACVACAGPVEDEGGLRHVCARCERALPVVAPPHCSTCGHPFFGESEVNRGCGHCETLRPVFGEGRTAILMQGPGRSLVHALKYHEGLHVLEDVRVLMARAPGYGEHLAGRVLVPVPLHSRKLRERGFNQSRLLAEAAAGVGGAGAIVKELLVRRLDTISQTRFDRKQRQENLKNAFAMAPGATINPGLSYLLIDDVFTTGATLNACAAVLRRAGAVKLDVATFGHG
jgi:competence protein ComFC